MSRPVHGKDYRDLRLGAAAQRGGVVGWTLVWSIVALVGGVYAVIRPGITLAGLISVIAGLGIPGGIALLVAAGRMQSVEATFARAADHGA